MPFRPGSLVSGSRALVAAGVLLLTSAAPALPQAAPSPPPSPGVHEEPPAPTAPEPPPTPENPGLINEMGKLIDRIMPSKSPGDTLNDFNTRARDAAKDAGEALSRLAKTGAMVSGRTICPPGTGGSPDCGAGASQLCLSKGFKEGKSLNTDAAEKCSAKVLIPGRPRKPDDCRTDTYVTAALCQ